MQWLLCEEWTLPHWLMLCSICVTMDEIQGIMQEGAQEIPAPRPSWLQAQEEGDSSSSCHPLLGLIST